ncbi:MalY/PatB family protein [Bailinhaonella thermotolerans]|uniref:cysteine-S-conjugate beta-lyase n=1 Tax=Bailinhaonella thermotolerans TaxID=1070861 RepID=A0A3A4AUH9_9ACTN|nr:aminotransferase class I/II-fold pyridoxal phosphate-dependent enzyme [Bailinhaonella thermotolerans]RJL31945.1 aminotransferase class I/II-fold pyridoxal phosphate-dependent enzyme [Bailinhaonella thermotolerans]
MSTVFDIPTAELRRRRSAKWTTYPSDVLPLPVAEMDVRLAPGIAAALHEAVERGDTGYAGDVTELVEAFRGFALRRWGWKVEPDGVATCADVGVGVVEVLRRLIRPGDGVLIMPPVYPSFYPWLRESGARTVAVPLIDRERGGRLDLDGIERALADGTRVVLLCHPHNPFGRVHTAEELRALAELARTYGAIVLSDEIHAPLTHTGQGFDPYLTVSDAAAETGIAFTSASKAFNVAGLKCALIIADGRRDLLGEMPEELPWGVGHLGLIASIAAFSGEDAWLERLAASLAANVALLRDRLAEALPGVTFPEPRASYLAWLDFRALGLGDDPAAEFLARARVALGSGPAFGLHGEGHARFNFGCSPELIDEAVTRMARALRS